LAGPDAVMPQRFRPCARKRNLTDGGRRLAVLEFERTWGQLEQRSAERDRARGYDQNVACVAMEERDILDQRGEPCLLYPPGRGVNQERRADLDDDAAEIFELGKFDGH